MNEEVRLWFHGKKGLVKVLPGTGPGEPPAEEPPAEEPPAEEPPAEEPPAEEPPAEEPPADEPIGPAEKEEPPAEEPAKEEPPAEEPQKEEPQKEEPQKEEPQKEEPPVDEGPVDSRFSYATGEIVELDAEGNEVASLNLERAYPQTSGCTIEDDGAVIHMTLNVKESVRGRGPPSDPVSVTFVYHFEKESRGAKFDLQVEGWPWSSNGTLAYRFDVQSPGATFEPAQNGVGMRDAEGRSMGFVEWAPEARAEYGDGHSETALVKGETSVSGSSARVTLLFGEASPGYLFLDYDPWAGLGEYEIKDGRIRAHVPPEDPEDPPEDPPEEPPAEPTPVETLLALVDAILP